MRKKTLIYKDKIVSAVEEHGPTRVAKLNVRHGAKDCRKCHKTNHFANVCKSKSSANQVKIDYDDESSESTSSSESYVYSLNASQTLKANDSNNDRLEINKINYAVNVK